ncbi:MAG: SBBP repeat-containing protein [Roseomonas sp.]|nr:SBBP repeat-containing protein [Roseomonas sp.]
MTGYTQSAGAGAADVLIAKYDTSGTIQWQRVLGGVSNDIGFGIALDSSGNCYVAGRTTSTGAGNNDVLIAKYDTSGTIQWQRVLGGGINDEGYGIALDSSGNCYVAGYTLSTGAGAADVLIAKYDTSGTIQWQRVLGGTNADYGQSIAVDSSGNCYVTGYTQSAGAGAADVLIAKLPGDGSKTGTYGAWIYQASSLTASTPSFTAATSSLTAATSTLTAATSSLTAATSTLTSTVTEL